MTTRQLSFSTPFTLRSTTPKRTSAHAFILYFDTFFDQYGVQVEPSTKADIAKEDEMILAEVWRVGGARARTTSRSTERGDRERLVRSPSPSRASAVVTASPIETSPALSPSSPKGPSMPKVRRASSFKSRGGTREFERETPKETCKSFTTGPQSTPTHWKQAFFLLKEPILMQHGRCLYIDKSYFSLIYGAQVQSLTVLSIAERAMTIVESLMSRYIIQSPVWVEMVKCNLQKRW